MLLNTPLPFVKTFIDELDNGLRAHEPGKGLSSTQRKWLGFCLMGILLTNSICWARFEGASLGKYKQSAEPVDVSSFPNCLGASFTGEVRSVKDFFVLRSSSKHMSGKDLGRLEPTPSLRHQATA